MPYEAECTCPLCQAARNIYSAITNQRNYVTAREHGADRTNARGYVGRCAGDDHPPTYTEWRNAQPASPVAFPFPDPEDYPEPDYEPDEEDTGNYSNHERERMLSEKLRAKLANPLHRILTHGGRYWSAEIEVNGISTSRAADVLACDRGDYSTKAKRDGTILATYDCTCDAEIKVGRFRDGAMMSQYALNVYRALSDHGAHAATNTGHHVHVDATRIVDLGFEAVESVLRSSLTLATALEPTLLALASTGYNSHRDRYGDGYAGSLKDSAATSLSQRTAWHAANASYAAADSPFNDSIPTFEYRLPNGTTEPIRAHAHIAVALGLLDFGERCYDKDQDALAIQRQARDRIKHGQDWSQADGAVILTRALRLSDDSRTAISVAADTAPTTNQTRQALAIGA